MITPTPRALGRALLMSMLLIAPNLWGQQQELSSNDRLAMLYTSQFSFSHQNDPLIRLGLAHGRETITFTPSETIRVLPHGQGGPEIELPGGKTCTVSVSGSRPGSYQHWVVVQRLPAGERGKLPAVKKIWSRRGYKPKSFEVGGLFALRGEVFDSRALLVGVSANKSLRKARQIKRKLEARYGIVGRIHSEIDDLPSATFTLSVEGLPIKIQANEVLWIAPREGREHKVRYRVPKIRRNYRKGYQTRQYTGTLVFAPDRKGKIVLMNTLGAEKVLKGVVPAEIYSTAPEEALKAQAIAARNEIFSAIGVRNLADPFMLRADVMDQVYGGTTVEKATSSAAVDATRGQVMFYKDEIVEAFYSSNAGGFTENNENVWDMEPRPYLRGRPDAPSSQVPVAFRDGISTGELATFLRSDFPAFSKKAPVGSARLYRWKRSVDVDKAHSWLKAAGYKIGRLKKVTIIKRGKSGRVVQLQLDGDKGRALIERELNVRRLFGGLRSGLFIMKVDHDARGYIERLHFDGAGFGHGVGMCQTGAAGMAAKGKKHGEILKHYYRGIRLRKLY